MRTKDFNKEKEDYYKGVARKWDLGESSSRPSPENVRHYNQLVKSVLGKKKPPRIVILGATPEIREMLYKYYFLNKAQVICLDLLPAKYYGLSNLVSHKTPNEKFIQGDWLKMPFKRNTIDAFIGDIITGNIYEEKDKEKLLSLINKCLKKNGAFITRQLYITPRAKIKDIKKHLFHFNSDILNEKISIKAAASSFWANLVISTWYKNKENKLSMVYLKNEIKNLNKYFKKKNLSCQDKIAKTVFKHFQLLGGQERYWTYGSKEQEEERLKKYFKMEKRLFAKDYYSAPNFPVYSLRPKK